MFSIDKSLVPDHEGFGLAPYELYWRDLCPYLQSRGYLLRPRYQPGWEPSWKILNIGVLQAEDHIGLPLHATSSIDAVRVSDNKVVYLKKVRNTSLELELSRYFSSQDLRDDPRNHCVPLLDVIPHPTDPEVSFMVMPWLRLVDRPPFETVDNALDFGEQLLEGLTFMHEHGIAHRDCAFPNVMMDASILFPEGCHPVARDFLPDFSDEAPRLPRSAGRVTYYLIDFGISSRFSPDDSPRLVLGRDGIDDSVPELSANVPYDPFKTDVYIAGSLLRQLFLKKYSNMDVIDPLVASMTEANPDGRPTISQVLDAWRTIQQDASVIHRWRRLKPRNEFILEGIVREIISMVHSNRGFQETDYQFRVDGMDCPRTLESSRVTVMLAIEPSSTCSELVVQIQYAHGPPFCSG
ncbi:hypothetical protein PYCCODRAFT_1368635 [Trametes coccinea BRFM310]|uniref:Protein kinase domain-containing protein n=1 Tax=Trametes coccinea (strain BRFM310) TaxID=1353009 RepID=A0A1Y2IMC6_TRAC3|nr:hypothetical protein PYCCODRAFT_1368635 [Trametes coccinea BRFM310]